MKSPCQIFSLTFLLSCLLQTPSSVHAVDVVANTTGNGNICDSDAQCENGGVCSEPNANHPHKYCHCAQGFVGIRCNSYCPLQCQNGGYCQYHETAVPRQFDQDRNPDDYVCQCFGLFEGPNCEVPYMNCGDGQRCYNGGVCRLSAPSESNPTIKSVCDCPKVFGGPTCQGPEDFESQQFTNEGPGTRRRKPGVVFGILFLVVSLACCSRYVTALYCEDEYSEVDPDEDDDGYGYDDDDDEISMKMPNWRNIV